MSAFLAPAASAVSGASPGDLKHSLAASLTGWLNASTGGSVGNAASGATLRANSDASALFAVIWNNVPDEQAPIYDSGGTQTARGASAAADFAAGKRLMIPPMAGRTLVAYDPSGSVMPGGNIVGLLTGAATRSVDLPTHNHDVQVYGNSPVSVDVNHDGSTADAVLASPYGPLSEQTAAAGAGSNPQDVSVVQPSTLVYIHIKL